MESQKLVEQKDNTIASQTEKVQELEATVKSLTVRVNDGMDRAAESKLLEGQYAEVKAENESLRENVSKLNKQNETLNEQVNILKDTADSHVTLSNDIIQKDKDLLEARNTIDASVLEIKMLKSRVEELNSANSTLKRSTEESALAEAEEISRLENELNDAIIYSDKNLEKFEKCTDELSHTKLLLEQATEEMKKLDTELSKAKSENKSILDSIQIKETKFQAIATKKKPR